MLIEFNLNNSFKIVSNSEHEYYDFETNKSFISRKLAQQRIEFFRVIRRISSLIYEFEFPNNMNIYPIISIIYLKLISKNSDSYNRFRNDYPASIKEDP
jgi:hypothetical protein